MAHNLNFNAKTQQYAFAAVGEKAWHGLGQYVTEAMTAAQAIELGGLNYLVEKQPVQIVGGAVIPGTFATVRTDTGDALGVVSADYSVIQNHEAFEFFDAIIDSGEAIFQTAGALGKGEGIFITAKLPADILVNGEQVENYLLLTAGHNGRWPIQAGFTGIRVVCNNTLIAALRGLQNKVTILHYSNAKENLKNATRVMGMASRYIEQLEPTFQRMAEVKITDKRLRAYIEEVMKPHGQKEQISREEFSKVFTNKVESVMAFAHDHETQRSKAARGTVWGAYNAVSGYYNYLKNYKSQEDKMQDVYFKNGSRVIEHAYELATAMI